MQKVLINFLMYSKLILRPCDSYLHILQFNDCAYIIKNFDVVRIICYLWYSRINAGWSQLALIASVRRKCAGRGLLRVYTLARLARLESTCRDLHACGITPRYNPDRDLKMWARGVCNPSSPVTWLIATTLDSHMHRRDRVSLQNPLSPSSFIHLLPRDMYMLRELCTRTPLPGPHVARRLLVSAEVVQPSFVSDLPRARASRRERNALRCAGCKRV